MQLFKRNNLIILTIIIVLSIIGVFWYQDEVASLGVARRAALERKEQFSGDLLVSRTLNQFVLTRDSLEKKLRFSPKKMVYKQEPMYSISYINRLVEKYGLVLDFDFSLSGRRVINGITIYSYTLTGEGDYKNFCSLIWYITHNPTLYKIKNVKLNRIEEKNDKLTFVLLLESYKMPDTLNEEYKQYPLTSVDWKTAFTHNAFDEKVWRPKKAPRRKDPDAGLLSITGASLVAVSNDKIYIRTRDNKMVSMKLGTRVRGGVLHRIDQERSIAMFRMRTKGGSRIVRLSLKYN